MEAVERSDCKDNKTSAQSNEPTLSSDDSYEVGYAVLEFPELAKTGFLRSRLISDEPVVLHIESCALQNNSHLSLDGKYRFIGQPATSLGTNLFFQLSKKVHVAVPSVGSTRTVLPLPSEGAHNDRKNVQDVTFLGYSRANITYAIARPEKNSLPADNHNAPRLTNSAASSRASDKTSLAPSFSTSVTDGTWLW